MTLKVQRIIGIVLVTVAVLLILYALFFIVAAEKRASEKLAQWDALLAQVTATPTLENSPTPQAQTTASPVATAMITPEPTVKKTPRVTPVPKALKGVLLFDSLDGRRVAVVEGVSDSDLRGAAGHYPGSSLPGMNGNCLIFGHRDGVFRDFGDLRKGDRVRFQTIEDTYTYLVSDILIVNPDDPLIKKNYLSARMTLVTCYPFNYIGAAPQRAVVILDLLNS